jgi:hypothetical protein
MTFDEQLADRVKTLLDRRADSDEREMFGGSASSSRATCAAASTARRWLGRPSATLRRVARPFAQVDVFTTERYAGNPVAVVLDGAGMSTMQRFAHWTNLSETTFVLAPESPDADYRLRIIHSNS